MQKRCAPNLCSAPRRAANWGLVVTAAWACLAFKGQATLAVEPASTLLIFNANDPDSVAIEQHYLSARPGVRSLGLNLPAAGEEVTADFYLGNIRQPLLDYLDSESLSEQIDTFVTTKGLPLRIDTGPQPPGNTSPKWSRFSSLESELTRVDAIGTLEQMGDQLWELGQINIPGVLPANPYYLGQEFDFFANPIPYAGPVAFDREAPINEGIRLVTRLDAFEVDDVLTTIDRSQDVYVVPTGHYVVIDDDPNAAAANESAMAGLSTAILPARGQSQVYDGTDNPLTSAPGPVIGYVSHGVNDGVGGLETGYIRDALSFELVDGAVFHSYESFNGMTFDPAMPQNQGLVAEWLEIGGTAALAHVAEPGANQSSVSNEDVFYDMMLSGHTFAEASWASLRQLSYVNTAVGDPLMRWKPWLPGDTNLDGVVEFEDFFTMQGNWGQAGGFEDGDFNGDNVIDAADFAILETNWLQSDEPIPDSDAPAIVAELTDPTATVVYPVLDDQTGWPELTGTLLIPANLDGDLAVDGGDAQVWAASVGVDAGGDIDEDGDTDLADLLAWQAQYSPYELTADFNLDRSADAADLNIWRSSASDNLGGDSDDDGDTDLADLLMLQREWDSPQWGGTATSTPVPEPSSLLLSCVALALGARQQRLNAMSR
ncbi:MAG: TIGR03790 family protein [Planctomycetota bacterium]